VRNSTSEVLGVVPVGPTSDFPIPTLKNELAHRFTGFTLKTMRTLPDPTEAFDSSRGQYHSTRLLVLLEEHLQETRADRLLGVTGFDLFVPGMNYVFGEARCPGSVAVVSTKRLRPFPRNTKLFRERLIKEAVHELGHTQGLKHCLNPICVMYFSEHIADTDRKGADFCRGCDPNIERLEVE
jgi:archaemetzincin